MRSSSSPQQMQLLFCATVPMLLKTTKQQNCESAVADGLLLSILSGNLVFVTVVAGKKIAYKVSKIQMEECYAY